MVNFNEEKQDQKIAQIRKKEEEELAELLSSRYGLEYADLSMVSINTDALRLIPEEEARASKIACFRLIGKKVHIAVFSPKNKDSQESIRKLKDKNFIPVLFMTSMASLERAWLRYVELSYATTSNQGLLTLSSDEIKNFLGKVKNSTDVEELLQKVLTTKKAYRISRVLEILLAGAMALEASDVHIEPEERMVRIRYRLDGILVDIASFDTPTYMLVLSRIKLLSTLKVNVKGQAQDGRFTIRVGNNDIEIRTSILPGAFADSVVMRLLDPRTIAVPIEELGYRKSILSVIEAELLKPNGMILNTGPTGSGKTTSLYAFLRHIHKPAIKIITIENPIEYHLPGIVQTQTNREYNFANGLRSALRQDPDVIMVGEIRDSETAAIAVNAALTGHLVFSTLHTNNAAGTFPRLIDLGVNPKVISSALNLVMAQRLVRKLCENCKKTMKLEGEDLITITNIIKSIYLKTFIPEKIETVFTASKCEQCLFTGYKGRISVVEAIVMDETVDSVIRQNPSESEIWRASKSQGLLTMPQDGILKVLEGITSLDDLRRVVDIDREIV